VPKKKQEKAKTKYVRKLFNGNAWKQVIELKKINEMCKLNFESHKSNEQLKN
jgi:hypothetical protein